MVFTRRGIDTVNIIIIQGQGISLAVPEDLETIAIIAVQPTHGAKPHKASRIPVNSVDLVVGKPVVNVQRKKLIRRLLCIGSVQQ